MRKNVAVFVALLIAACSAIAQPKAEQAGDPVVLTVGAEKQFTVAQLRAYGQRRNDLKALLSTPTGLLMVAEEMAMTEVLVKEGEKIGLPRPPVSEEDQSDSTLNNDLYAFLVYKKLVQACPELNTKEEEKKYYDSHPDAFVVPAQARVSRLVLPIAEKMDIFDAKSWLKFQARAVTEGQASFEKLLERAEEKAPKLAQGDIGWIALTDTSPIIQAIAEARQGDLVGPIEEGDFVMLLKVTEKRAAQQIPWESVQHQIKKRAMEYCQLSQREQIRNRLYKEYGVKIVSDPRGIVTEKPAAK